MGEVLSALHAELAEVGPERFTARDYRPESVRHIVLFRYRPDVTPAERDEVARRFRALADSRRADGPGYIVSIEAGVQASGEGAGQEFDLGVVVTFSSVGDRNYYVGTPVVEDSRYFDGVHAEFKDFAGPYLDGVQVFDILGA
jgi:hypothetical protein